MEKAHHLFSNVPHLQMCISYINKNNPVSSGHLANNAASSFAHFARELLFLYIFTLPPLSLFNLLQVLLLTSSLSSVLTMKDKPDPGYLDGLGAEVSETS